MVRIAKKSIAKHRRRERRSAFIVTFGLFTPALMLPLAGCSQQGVEGRPISAQRDENTGARLGISVRETNGSLAITQVDDESPAARAGLQVGDELIAANSTRVNSAPQLREQLEAANGANSVALEVRRDGQSKTLVARVGETQDTTTTDQTLGESPAKTDTDETDGSTVPGRYVVGYRGDPTDVVKIDAPNESATGEANEVNEPTATDAESTETPSDSTTADSTTADSTTADSTTPDSTVADSTEETATRTDSTSTPAAEPETVSPKSSSEDEATQRTRTNDRPADSETDTELDTEAEVAPEADANNAAAQASSDSEDVEPAATAEEPEITAEEVETKLEEAQQALEGFMHQKAKLDYRKQMESKLSDFDEQLEPLRREVSELEQRLTQKKQRLKSIGSKRDAFVKALNAVDPASSDAWTEKRERIQLAWDELTHARQEDHEEPSDGN